MTARLGGIVLAALMLAVLVAALWLERSSPREIVATGSVRVVSPKRPETAATLATRTVRIAGREVLEVRLPNGTWIDCGGDCRKAALAAGPDFFDALGERQGR